MRFGVIGINFKSAQLQLREQISQVMSRLYGLESLGARRHTCVLLSTCNRCELYFHDPDPTELHGQLLKEMGLALDIDFKHALYSFFDQECLMHLSKVAAGFDSAFVFESEIQGQVKRAYLNSTKHPLPSALHYLFQKGLHNGKTLRTEVSNGEHVPALPSVVARQVLSVQPQRVLIVGDSDIGRSCTRALRRRGYQAIDVVTRYGNGLPWHHLTAWPTYDVVIATSKTQKPLLLQEHIQGSLNTKALFDLCMPRCVDPRLPVIDIDDLAREMEQMREMQQESVLCGEKKIREIVTRQFKLKKAICA